MMTAARQARLNSESGGGAWCPRQMIDLDHKLEEWLEVRLCSVFLSEHAILIQKGFKCIYLLNCLSTYYLG